MKYPDVSKPGGAFIPAALLHISAHPSHPCCIVAVSPQVKASAVKCRGTMAQCTLVMPLMPAAPLYPMSERAQQRPHNTPVHLSHVIPFFPAESLHPRSEQAERSRAPTWRHSRRRRRKRSWLAWGFGRGSVHKCLVIVDEGQCTMS
eukprot:1144208-Pelagomonas_calceolata.AAC.6